MTIAISKGTTSHEKYKRYAEWIGTHVSDASCIDLDAMEQKDAMAALMNCDALVLSGGPDIDPRRYEQGSRASECSTDIPRDEREYEYLRFALEKNLPILGICRGMQLINVYFGGSLVVDIPKDISSSAPHKKDEGDEEHSIVLTRESFLGKKGDTGLVNSSHHQSVERVAPNFEIIACASDGISEAMVPLDPEMRIICVQWHPERMQIGSPFSEKVISHFTAMVFAQSKVNFFKS